MRVLFWLLILFSATLRAEVVEKPFSKVRLLVDINLTGIGWADLGLSKSETFSSPIQQSWAKWLTSNLPANMGEVTVCDLSCQQYFAKWEQLPQAESMPVAEEYKNNIWFKVSFNLARTEFSAALNEWKFEWNGRVVLLDSNNKRILGTQELQSETKTWRGLVQKNLNSNLASSMYRSPLSAFSQLLKKVGEDKRLNRLMKLVIIGHQRLGDVISLMDVLKKEGQNMGLELKLDQFNPKEAQLLCFYQGEEKSFSDLLSRVKELKSSHSYSIVNDFNGVHHRLQLVTE